MNKKYFLVLGISVLLVSGYTLKCLLGIDVFESYSFSRSIFNRSIKPLAFAAENNLPVEYANLSKKYYKENIIQVSVDQEKGTVNNKIFGNNLLGHDPSIYRSGMKPNHANTNFGAGIWDGKWEEEVNDVIDLAKNIDISILRFPGGCGAHYYNWKETIGEKRMSYLFGLNEFLEIADMLGADVVFTVSYFTGNEEDAADLVEYLNAVNDGSNLNGGIDWAKRRAKNGYEKPFGVKYFEIGNEIQHGNHKNIKVVLPQEYEKRYLKYYSAMKKVDQSIKIGFVLGSKKWNEAMGSSIKGKVDFGIIHFYPSAAKRHKIRTMEKNEIFYKTLSSPNLRIKSSITNGLNFFKEKTDEDIPIAVTEFNGGFVQNEPVPYRHTMGNALVNAELLKVFMMPENNILIANYWNFVNEYWGMIANGFDGTYKTLNNPYYKRPNYYVFELYKKHFGKYLIDSFVNSEFYDVRNYPDFSIKLFNDRKGEGRVEGENLIDNEWQIKVFEGVDVLDKDNVLSITFSGSQSFNYYHVRKWATVEPDEYYRLSGYIRSDQLIDREKNGVCLEVQDGRGWTKTKPAISTEKIKGTTDWTYVEAIYRTLPDAKLVNVIARRIGEEGPLKGKAYFKDVKLEKFIPDIDTKIPYLSVNASKNEDGSKIYLMVVNKNLEEEMTSTIELKDFIPDSKGDAWVLNGPEVDSTNEVDHDNVKITHKEFEIDGSKFQYTFEPHSLTAIEINRKVER